MKSRIRTALSLSAVAVGLGLSIPPALAQDPAQKAVDSAQPVDRVAAPAPAAKPFIRKTQTGSNIARVRNDESLPVSEYDRTYIDRTGASTTAEMLRTIPQIQISR